MEKTFDSGKHRQDSDKTTKFHSEIAVTDGEEIGKDMYEESSKIPPLQEQTQESEQLNADFISGSKRYLRTQSLEKLSRPSSAKQRGRFSRASEKNTSSRSTKAS